MTSLFRRLGYLLNRRRFDKELADDMEFHREMAAREGKKNFGNTLRLREEARDAWGWTWIDRFSQDLRFTLRMLRKSPGFTTAAVLMLALGIGVNVAAFGFFNLMLLRPLPIRHPETILHFQRRSPQNAADNFPYPEVAFFREHSQPLSAVLALSFDKLSMDGEEKPLNTHFVTANFLSELGAHPALGRILDPTRDEAADAPPVAVLSYGFWQRRFGADPSIVGRTIRLDGKPATIVGVAVSGFSGLGLGTPDLWVPINQQPYFSGGSQYLSDFSGRGIQVQMWGRLRPNLNPKVAEDELSSLAAELHRRHPDDIWDKETLPSEPGGYAVTIRPEMYPIFALAAALGLLILIAACGNLGSLLLARGVAREKEMAIRVAVGAGRARLIRQLFTENLVLASLGLIAGVALGYIVLRSLILWTGLPSWLDPIPDGRVIVFAVGIGTAAAILFGLTPSLQVARQRHRATVMRQILIGAQVAASCVLLIVAALLVRALNHATFTNPGFAYQKVISIDPALRGYTPAKARAYFEQLEPRLRQLPGVESMSLVSNPPLGNRWTVDKTQIAGHAVDVHFNNIDPDFFQTMEIPVLRGRNLISGEKRSIVVSESLARRRWPLEDPVGKSFEMGADRYTVVGVCGSARLVSPEDSDAVEVYELAGEDLMPSMVLLLRTSIPPEGIAHQATAAAKAIDPRLFPEVQLMKEAFRGKLEVSEYVALAAGLPGLIALLLACLGILGLVSFAVSQRTKEIGIRMALGAKPADVLSTVMRQFAWPIGVGFLIGIAAAAALSQILRQVLYGVSNLDPISYLAAIAIFAITTAIAVVLPAKRALRIDPMRALHYE